MLPITRRDMLARVGTGLGIARPGRPSCTTAACWRAERPGRQSAGAEAVALPAAGQAHHPSVHERRPVAGRYVRPQAGPRRSTTARSRRPPAQHRAPHRRPDAVAVQVRQARPSRACEVSEIFPARRQVRRRSVRHPLDAHQHAQPRAVAADDDLRRHAADAAEHGFVAALRPGHARTRTCPASSSCARASRSSGRSCGATASCPASTRARTSTTAGSTRRACIANISNRLPAARRPARAARPAATSSTSMHLEQRGGHDNPLEARIQSLEMAFRMQSEAQEVFDLTRETEGDARAVRHAARSPTPACSPGGWSSAACAWCRSSPATASRGTTTATSCNHRNKAQHDRPADRRAARAT